MDNQHWTPDGDTIEAWYATSLADMQAAHDAGNIWRLRELVNDASRWATGYWVLTYTRKVDGPTGKTWMVSPCPNMMALVVEKGWELLGTCDPSRYRGDPPQDAPLEPAEYDAAEAWARQRMAAALRGGVVKA